MDTQDKIELLSEASQYDLACACGTGGKDRRHRGVDGRWLYPVPVARGGQGIMLKSLLGNECVNDCRYCPFRAGSDVRRVVIQPEEMAHAFMEYDRREDLIGLFLSSGVMRDPDYTMARLNETARILRQRYRYRGYIHLKVIPGASDAAIEDALSLASAVSVNIEVPGEAHCRRLSTRKDYLNDIIRPMKLISRLTARGAKYAGVCQTTQFVVGAASETDAEIVRYTGGLYKRLGLDRAYFSAYQRGLGEAELASANLPPGKDPLLREHRLYQVDFLLRRYGFDDQEIPFEPDGSLALDRDPKQAWAERHPEFFPVRLSTAPREGLLRVPGLGPTSVTRILASRKEGRVRDLREVGVRGKRLLKASAYVAAE
ncbi:MAG: hypothetical protein A3K19_02785 [Lentisphaerae bacterium RIFOXYB12_FULL_65_16]|nr:MAG: hypothetical protein A3K18_19835 [Lentisphaerae bacterium RIFOXYA12_64_32]OGV92324.1 MAG: hypothetical protein A3K19_02785 [Lentisphaerae bacterium RIFOXYB12_FULL_65_16]